MAALRDGHAADEAAGHLAGVRAGTRRDLDGQPRRRRLPVRGLASEHHAHPLTARLPKSAAATTPAGPLVPCVIFSQLGMSRRERVPHAQRCSSVRLQTSGVHGCMLTAAVAWLQGSATLRTPHCAQVPAEGGQLVPGRQAAQLDPLLDVDAARSAPAGGQAQGGAIRVEDVQGHMSGSCAA